jgi:hypothetical protein
MIAPKNIFGKVTLRVQGLRPQGLAQIIQEDPLFLLIRRHILTEQRLSFWQPFVLDFVRIFPFADQHA